jgi:hypothetical protein
VNGWPVQNCLLIDGDQIIAGQLQLSIGREPDADPTHGSPDAEHSPSLRASYRPPEAPPPGSLGSGGAGYSLGGGKSINARLDDMSSRASNPVRSYKQDQHVVLGVISGLVAAVIVAVLWQFVPRFHWTIFYGCAWLLGKLVGWAVRQGTAKFEPTDRLFVGSSLAVTASILVVFACLAGELGLVYIGGADMSEYQDSAAGNSQSASVDDLPLSSDSAADDDAEYDASSDSPPLDAGPDLAGMAEHMPTPTASGMAFSAVLFLVLFKFRFIIACCFAAQGAFKGANPSLNN